MSPQHTYTPSQTPEHPLPQKWRDLCQPTSTLTHQPVCPPLGSHSSPDHPPRHHGEGWELGSPYSCRRQGQRRRAMSAISTCHSPPSLATGHKGKFPFISTSSAPGLFLPPIVKGSQRRRERHSLHSETGRLRFRPTGAGARQGEIWKTEVLGERNQVSGRLVYPEVCPHTQK